VKDSRPYGDRAASVTYHCRRLHKTVGKIKNLEKEHAIVNMSALAFLTSHASRGLSMSYDSDILVASY